MNNEEKLRNEIDDYKDTIYAMIGFINFYRWDDSSEKMKDDVLVFQGRRLVPSRDKKINKNGEEVSYVTPDIGILLPSKNGVLGEAKKSFPENQEYWIKTFKQLMSYDDDLTGWPSENEKVMSHDIVLLLHQTRAVAVYDYYKKNTEIKFIRPFIIVQFNRVDERKPYYYFEKRLGNLTEKYINDTLHNGKPVPMEALIKEYSMIKIYDSKPPLPYLIDLIWTNVVLDNATKNPKFGRLRKKQKIEIILDVDTIVDELHKGFSFYVLYKNYSERQPKIPKKEWVVRALERLIKSEEAEWMDFTKSSIKVLFQIYKSTLDHFIEICSEDYEDEKQIKIFNNSKN